MDSLNNLLLEKLNSMLEQAECDMANMIGAKLYKSGIGFSQEQIYMYGGRYDSVFTLTLKKDSDSYLQYGESLTVCFVYTLTERQMLEKNVSALNEKSFANAKFLGFECDKDIVDKLLNEGVDTKDIVEMLVLPSRIENNTFPSSEKRSLNILDIPFETKGNGNDIDWMYGFLKKMKSDGVGLMPEDEAEYLAYKLILEREALTCEEKNVIFDKEGRICNDSVSYYYLLWKKAAGLLSEKQNDLLNKLIENKFYYRINLLNKILNDLGSNIEKFFEKYPSQGLFLLEKARNFHDRSFNTTGKYPLYMNFNSFLHIYFRHTEELNVFSQFKEKDKFQLKEKDIINVIDIVMRELNDDYQIYKEQNPDGRFYRRGKKAYYYNGDYYNVDVNPDGSISTFYKGVGRKK